MGIDPRRTVVYGHLMTKTTPSRTQKGNTRKPGNFRLAQLTLLLLKKTVLAHGQSQGKWIDDCVQHHLGDAIKRHLAQKSEEARGLLELLNGGVVPESGQTVGRKEHRPQ